MATRTKALAQAYSPEQYAQLAKMYAAPDPAHSGMTDDDLEELFSRRNVPIYSAGQGLAEAGGKIAESYLRRKAREKQATQQAGDYKSLASAITGAGAPMTMHQANTSGGYEDMAQQAMPQNQTSNAGVDPMQMQPYKMANPDTFNQAQAPDNTKLAALLQNVPDRLKLQALPVIQQEMARVKAANQPTMLPAVKPGEVVPQRNPDGSISTAFSAPPAPVKTTLKTPEEEAQQIRIANASRAPSSEPLVQIPDPQDPTRAIFVPREQAVGQHAFQTPRDRMPKMQTYFGEDGTQMQLDSNDPEDQKVIKQQGLVTTGPSDNQRTAKGFLDRMARSEAEMTKILESGFDPANVKDSATASVVPGGFGTSDKYKQFKQLAEDWYRAKLRKESGAVIGKDEALDEVKTYFPSASDDPTTKANKLKSRIEAQRQLATDAGILGKPRLRELSATVPNSATDYSKMTDDEIKAALAARGTK